MSDANLIACNESYELKTVLKKYGKSTSEENTEKLKTKCKEFKSDDSYKPHNRESFYKYINDKKVLSELE